MRNPFEFCIATWFVIISMLCVTTSSLWADSQTRVFQDDFGTVELFIEYYKPSNTNHWAVRDDVLVGFGGVDVNTPVPENCRVELDVCLRKDMNKDGFSGLRLGGVNFLIRPDGLWYAYRVEGVEKAIGQMSRMDMTYGKFYRLAVTRKVVDNGFVFTWDVDGKRIAEFTQMSKIQGQASQLTLVAHRIESQFDNLAIHQIIAGHISPNTILNSSFEYVWDGLPAYWKNYNTREVSREFGSHDVFWQMNRLDATQAHSGKQSLRIQTNDQVTRNGFSSHNSPVSMGHPFTFSIWLKADQPNIPATLIVWETYGKHTRKPIVVGTQWQRFSLTVDDPKKTTARGGLQLKTPAVIWADDAQMQVGSIPTDYEPASGDVVFTQDEQPNLQPTRSYALAQGKPTFDGNIGDDWRNALVLDDFRIAGPDMKPSREKTVARLLADEDYLYIGYTCYTQAQKLKVISGDTLKLFAGDCADFFIDTAGTRMDSYHFGVNPDGGKKAIGRNGNLAWQPDWQVRTSRHADRWEAEIRIPFESLDIFSRKWTFNLGRNNSHANEVSCTARVGANAFAMLSQFDTLTLPALSKLNVASSETAMEQFFEPMVYTQRSYYMSEAQAMIIVNLPSATVLQLDLNASDGKTLWSEKMQVKAGKNRLAIPIEEIEDGRFTVQVSDSHNGVLGKTVLIKRSPHANAVQVDHDRNCLLVEGKPYLPVAPLTDLRRVNLPDIRSQIKYTIQYYADAGFKTLMLGGKPQHASEVREVLDHAHGLGIKVVMWPWGRAGWQVSQKFVEALQDHPAILAWLAVDEPELWAQEQDVIQTINHFREQDPYHPIFMNNSRMGVPSRYAGLNTDLLSIDDYLTNRVGRTVADTLESIKMMCDVSQQTRKPSFAFHSGNNLHNHYREPFANEQIAQTYGGIIYGMAGCWYFLGMPSTREHWQAYKQVNQELLSLTDVIFSSDQVMAIKSTDDSVLTMTRKYAGRTYLITVNIADRPVLANFQLPGGNASAKVLFEDRSLTVKNGILQDTYEALQRHVYVLEANR